MTRRTILLAAMVTAMATMIGTAAEEAATGPPITEIQKLKPKQGTFKPQGVKKPHVVDSAETAKKLFGKEYAKKLAEQVDFKKRTVLVFAWRGSGQDKLSYSIAESYPEQISFSYKAGRTKDLQSHMRVYSLRKNVTWTAPR